MLGHADKAEANFTATGLLAAATARIAALEKELADLKATSAEATVQITGLTTQLATASTNIAAKDAEIKTIQGQLAKANTKAEDVIAGQGLSADQLPAADASDAQGKDKKSAWQKYQELAASNPREAGAYWAAHAEEILRSRA